MDAKDLQSLDLRSFNPEEKNLQLPSQFFKPWSLSKLQQHEKNLEDQKASDMLHSFETVMREGDPFLRELGGYETWRRTRSLCTRLSWEVQMFPRKGTTGNRLALKSLTHWRCSDGLPFTEDLQPIFLQAMQTTNKLPPWSVTHSWTLSSDTPHIKMCMYHGTDGDPSRVFCGELFSIIAIMLQRLQLEELKKHLIIPVMLISFVGEEHGRILLAHFNGEKLIIHMSPLYRFRVEDEDSMLLFTRYLASDIDPQGVTKSLDLKKPLDSGVLSNVGKPGDSRHSVSHSTPLGLGK